MTAVSFGGAYVTDIFVVQRLKIFYDQNEVGSKAGYQILLALSTQLLGYGCAGITRRFLVYPAQVTLTTVVQSSPNGSLVDDLAFQFGCDCAESCDAS